MAADGWQKQVREKAIDVLLLGLPVAVAEKLWDLAAGSALKQPRQTAWCLIPVVVLLLAAWRFLGARPLRLSGWKSRAFLALFVVLFALASRLRLLDWNRNVTVLGSTAPHSWLTPARLGDWRYGLARQKRDSDPQLLIVTTRSSRGRHVEETRLEMANLVRMAQNAGAKGIAFDFSLELDSKLDSYLCTTIAKSGIPVVLGQAVRSDGSFRPLPLPTQIQKCAASNLILGHLAGFADTDRRVRLIPLSLGNGRPSLSRAVVDALYRGDASKRIEEPADGLLRFVEPAVQSRYRVRYADLVSGTLQEQSAALADRFALVGDETEMVRTPFGDRLGVELHADAIHSLRDRTYLRTLPGWADGLTVVVVCYLMIVVAQTGRPARHLLMAGALASVAMAALSAAAMAAAQVWIDVVYPLAAIWLMVPLLLVRRGMDQAGPH